MSSLQNLVRDLRLARMCLCLEDANNEEVALLLTECRALIATAAAVRSRFLSLPEELLLNILTFCRPEALAMLDATCSTLHGGRGHSMIQRALPAAAAQFFGAGSPLGHFSSELLRERPLPRLLASLEIVPEIAERWVTHGASTAPEDREHVPCNLITMLTVQAARPLHIVLEDAFKSKEGWNLCRCFLGDKVFRRLRHDCRLEFLVAALLAVLSAVLPEGKAPVPMAIRRTLQTVLHALKSLGRDVPSETHPTLLDWAGSRATHPTMLGLLCLLDHANAGPSVLEVFDLESYPNPWFELIVDPKRVSVRLPFLLERLIGALWTHTETDALHSALTALHDMPASDNGKLSDEWQSALCEAALHVLKGATLRKQDTVIRGVLQLIMHGEVQFLDILTDALVAMWAKQLTAVMRVYPDMGPNIAHVSEQEDAVWFCAVEALASLTEMTLWGAHGVCATQRHRPSAFERELVSALPLLTEPNPLGFDALDYDEDFRCPPAGITCAVRALGLMAASPTVARMCAAPIAEAVMRALIKFPVIQPKEDKIIHDGKDRTDLWEIGIKTLGILALHNAAAMLRMGSAIKSTAMKALELQVASVHESVLWLLTFLKSGMHDLDQPLDESSWPPEVCFLRAFHRECAHEPSGGLAQGI